MKILNFFDTENDKNIYIFINIVKNYYYNNDLPTTKEQAKMKEWFKLDNSKDIEKFISSINDNQYDQMIEIVKLNKKVNDDIGAVPYHKKCDLPVFMGSLDKIKQENDYLNWKKKLSKSDIIVTEKLDGISALLCIDKKEIKLYTRGNGKIGCDISHLVKHMNLENQINNIFSFYKNSLPIYIRGELVISKFVWLI